MTLYANIVKNRIEYESPQLLGMFLSRLEGKRVTVDIKKWYHKRSDNQNKYYWGVVIPYLCGHTGYESEEMHDVLRVKFLTEESLTNVPPKIGRTSKLSTMEMEDYLDKIRRWADIDLQLYIPLPNEQP